MDLPDERALLGERVKQFLRELTEIARAGSEDRVHFVTAREMVNMVLAACDGRKGNPGRIGTTGSAAGQRGKPRPKWEIRHERYHKVGHTIHSV